MKIRRRPTAFVIGLTVISALMFFFVEQGEAQNLKPNRSREAKRKNMALVGHSDLQGRSAYQPVIHPQGGKWIAYVGHHGGSSVNYLTKKEEPNGTSILDVTDPKLPVYLHHIPAEQGSAQMAQICSGKDLPGADSRKVYLLRTNGRASHEIWDVTRPRKPVFLKTVVETQNSFWGRRDTHKNWWDCKTGMAYLVSSVSGWRTSRVMQVFNLSDPSRPLFIRNYGLVGQEPGSTGRVPAGRGLHEAVLYGNRLYLAYGTNSRGVFQIVDRDKLLKGNPSVPQKRRFSDTPENLSYAQVGIYQMPYYWGGHTAFPLIGMKGKDGKIRDFAVLVSESTRNECNEPRHVVTFFEITDERKPKIAHQYQVPENPGDFCRVGGRFGPHATNWSFTETFFKKVLFVSYFNAGVRALDVRNPAYPKEVAFFIPATTANTAPRGGKIAIQTNNVEVDERGYIYLVDRANTGMHIVELKGPARKIAGLP